MIDPHWVFQTLHPGRCSAAALTMVIFSVLGCGDGLPPRIPVAGQVTLDGKPIEGAQVVFHPVGGIGREASAYTNEDGDFEITSFNTGDGAVAGQYKIVVTKMAQEMPAGLMEKVSKMKPDEIQELAKKHREMVAAPPKSMLPKKYGDVTTTPLQCTVPVADDLHLELKSESTPDGKEKK